MKGRKNKLLEYQIKELQKRKIKEKNYSEEKRNEYHKKNIMKKDWNEIRLEKSDGSHLPTFAFGIRPRINSHRFDHSIRQFRAS